MVSIDGYSLEAIREDQDSWLSCDPVKAELSCPQVLRMMPVRVVKDWRNGQWRCTNSSLAKGKWIPRR